MVVRRRWGILGKECWGIEFPSPATAFGFFGAESAKHSLSQQTYGRVDACVIKALSFVFPG